jgi:hypothetical protein
VSLLGLADAIPGKSHCDAARSVADHLVLPPSLGLGFARMQATEKSCPSCGCADIARLETVHEQGTTDTEAIAIGAGSGLDVFAIDGVSMTRAAKRAAPPPKKDEAAPLLLILVAVVMLFVGLVLANQPQVIHPWAVGATCGLLPCAILGSLGIFWWRHRSHHNETMVRYQRAAWAKRWMCKRCGSVFTPQGSKR